MPASLEMLALIEQYAPREASFASAAFEAEVGASRIRLRMSANLRSAPVFTAVEIGGEGTPWPRGAPEGGETWEAFCARVGERTHAPLRVTRHLGGSIRFLRGGWSLPWEAVRDMARAHNHVMVGDGRFRGDLGRVSADGQIAVVLRYSTPRADEGTPALRASYPLDAWLRFYELFTGEEPRASSIDYGTFAGLPGEPPPLRDLPRTHARSSEAIQERWDLSGRTVLPGVMDGRGPEGRVAGDADALIAWITEQFGAGSILEIEGPTGPKGPEALGVFEVLDAGGVLRHARPAPLLRASGYTRVQLVEEPEPWGTWVDRFRRKRGFDPRPYYALRRAHVLPPWGAEQRYGPGTARSLPLPPDLVASPGGVLSEAEVLARFAGVRRVYLRHADQGITLAEVEGGRLVRAFDREPLTSWDGIVRVGPSSFARGATDPPPGGRYIVEASPGGMDNFWRVLDLASGSYLAGAHAERARAEESVVRLNGSDALARSR